MAKAATLAISVGCLINDDGGTITRNTIPTTGDGGLMGGGISPATGASGPVTGDIDLAAIASSPTASFDGLVN